MGIFDKASLIIGIITAIVAVKGISQAIPYVQRVGTGIGGIVEVVAGGIEGARTTICNYTSFIPNVECDAEPTVVTVTPDPVIVIPPPVVVPSTGNDVQCVNYRDPQGCGTHPYINSQYESCLGVNVQDGKCTCQVSQQCVEDIDQQTCQNTTDVYWEDGQCKPYKFINPAEPFIPLEDAVDDVTGEKVQDILNDRFVDGGGDLQECENKGGIVVGNYFTSRQSDAVTTCVPKERVPITTRYSLERHCQDYCNRNNYDIGSINTSSNTCVCDGVPQIHLASLTGLSIQDIDIALS